MSLPDLHGTFYPDNSRWYQSEWFEKLSFPIYQGDTFNGDLIINNSGTESTEAFDIDLYISTDRVINTDDYRIGTYNVAGGIEGESSLSTFFNLPKNPATVVLPDSDDLFWQDQETYYLGAIVDPDNAIAESNEDNNSPDSSGYYFDSSNASIPITIKQADLPVVSFTQHDDTLRINLSEPAPEEGFTISYQNVTREDYLNGINIPDDYEYEYSHRYFGGNFYDPEYDRFYIQRENYYDLKDYKYYDADGGHYDPAKDKYFNADSSYYDVGEKLFYDAEGNVTELTDNSDEYSGSSSSPRHYLPTGGYISLLSGIYYDALGGYIDKANQEYFFREGENGKGNSGRKIEYFRGYGAIEFGFGVLPTIATPDLDYEVVLSDNITYITDSTITIAPGEISATIDFHFLSDSISIPMKQ